MLLAIEAYVAMPHNNAKCYAIKTNIHGLFFTETIIS